MKKTKLIVSFVIAFTCICTITSCSKEQTTDFTTQEYSSRKSVGVSNEKNPYDYCGRIHNEILDYIISNNPHPTNLDIFNLSKEYLQKHYDYSCNITFETVNNDYNATTDFIINAFLDNTSFDSIFNSKIVAEALDTLVAYSNSIIESNTLPSPVNYADYLIEQEKQILKKRQEAGVSSNEVSEYDIALGTLAIARYSYSYWYNVANNPNHLWNHAKTKTKKQDGDDPKPGFWKRLWDGFCDVVIDVAEVVVQVAATPIVDAIGFVAEGIQPNNNPSIFGPNFNILNGIHGAGIWSAEVWK